MALRKATFAGSWYPASASECRQAIKDFLSQDTAQPDQGDHTFVGGIVPHAGWYYSGGIACRVIEHLARGTPPDVILIFGMHLHAGSPWYIMRQGAWETPLGPVKIDQDLADTLIKAFPFTVETRAPFAQDNTIELQLPFIKHFFDQAAFVPIGVPAHSGIFGIAPKVAAFARQHDLRIKVLGSTDLTHYGVNYGYTPRGVGSGAVTWVRDQNDRRIIETMLAMDHDGVIKEAADSQNACCAGAAAAAIATAKQLGAGPARMIEYATSYDKSPGDSFVGYVGILF